MNINNTNPEWTYDNLTDQRKVYVDAIIQHGPDLGIDCTKDTFCRAELRQISMREKGKRWIPNWITHDTFRRADVGIFHLPEVADGYALTCTEATDEVESVNSEVLVEA